MSKQPTLYSFADVSALASGLRQYVLQAQSDGLKRHDAFKVAVSGGSLPATLAKALLAPGSGEANDTVQWDKWEIFFADERAVPLDHSDSNYKLLKDDLLDKLPADGPKPTVHTINVQHLEDIQEMADDYEQVLVKSFAAKDSVKTPVFDLLLLGCGPDGHTCSLFPGHPLLRETDAWVAPISDSPKPPSKRITLTLPVVTHALRLAFVTSGASKQDILKKIFDSEEGPSLPSGLINATCADKVSWFADAAAVEGVVFPTKSHL
jgi:6-phosphogluconolactonase